MRTPESVTRLLYDLYVSHEWEELEEYFIVAEQLVLLHMGHFRIWSDVYTSLYNHPQFTYLYKYSDSEEAWREEINRIPLPIHFEEFQAITNAFIYFNQKINLL